MSSDIDLEGDEETNVDGQEAAVQGVIVFSCSICVL